MKIGIFDSGLGGLGVGLKIMETLPQYDYIYLGDTQRVPYGNRSQETMYRFVCQALDYLFAEECLLVILACNTASAEALRRVQQEYLPAHFPERKVLGVLIPAAEVAVREGKRIGVIATAATVEAAAFPREILKLKPDAFVIQQSAPLLVPLIENDGQEWIEPILARYLVPLATADIDTLILGCTHYVFLKDTIQKAHPTWNIVSQAEIIPERLANYLERHSEIATKLSQGGHRTYLVTDLTPSYQELARDLTGSSVTLSYVEL